MFRLSWAFRTACSALGSIVLAGAGICIGGCVNVAGITGKPKLRGHSHFDFSISPAGDKLLFTAKGRGESDLYLLHRSTSRVEPLTDSTEFEEGGAFAPDGHHVVYAASDKPGGPSHLYLLSLDGTTKQQLTADPQRYDRFPSFSPDGKRIVFARAHRERAYSMGGRTWDLWDLYAINTDGTGLKRLTNQNYYSTYPPRFTPDGKQLLFAANPLNGTINVDLLIVPALGMNTPKPITTNGKSSAPSLSADGQQFVFISDRAVPYEYELHVMNKDGSNPVQVTQNRAYNANPLFTPNGKQILFFSDPERDLRYTLWQVDVDGKNPHQIADEGLFDNPLAWKPRK